VFVVFDSLLSSSELHSFKVHCCTAKEKHVDRLFFGKVYSNQSGLQILLLKNSEVARSIILQIAGGIDTHNLVFLSSIVTACTEKGYCNFVIDMNRVTFIGRSFVDQSFVYSTTMERKRGVFLIVSDNRLVSSTFIAFGRIPLPNLFNSIEEANSHIMKKGS
jgi:anti-anti-sigma regulatory factor